MIGTISHVGFSVESLPRSIHFYRDLLGMDLVSTRVFGGHCYARTRVTGQVATLQAASTRIELFEIASAAPERRSEYRAFNALGIAHICIVVPNLAAKYEELKAAGVAFHCPPIEATGTRRVIVAAGRDVDGNVFEMMQLVPRGGQPTSDRSSIHIDHVALSVSKLEMSLSFYRDALGMEPFHRRTFDGQLYERITGLPDARGSIAFLKAGNVRFELIEFTAPQSRTSGSDRGLCNLGISHFCIEVPSIEAQRAKLEAAGVVFQDDSIELSDDATRCFARDPMGNLFALRETE